MPRTVVMPRSGCMTACFSEANPLADKDKRFIDSLNPNSLEVLTHCKLESSLGNAAENTRYQFERLGYFYADKQSTPEQLIYNRIVTLRDSWAKISNH